MADNNFVTVSNNIGALTNDFRPLFKVPAGFGGITVLEASYITETAGTSLVQIVDLGTAGTAVAASGTVFAPSAEAGNVQVIVRSAAGTSCHASGQSASPFTIWKSRSSGAGM